MKLRQTLGVLLLQISATLFAANIGSDTTVTRFNTQQILDNGDRVAGFAALAAGFALDDGINFATFDCFFPVEGQVDLNFGTLVLFQDLKFNNSAVFVNLGNIVGNGSGGQQNIKLSPSMNVIPTVSTSIACSIGSSPLATAAGGTIIHSVDWDVAGTSIAIALVGGGTSNNVEIYEFNGTSLSFSYGTQLGTEIMNSVNWHPFNEWLALARNTGSGGILYNYSWNGSTLTLLSDLTFGASAFSVAWHPLGTFVGVGTNLAAQQLRVYPVNALGVFGAAITSNLLQQVNSVSWIYDGSYIASGTNTGSASQLYVHLFNGTTLTQEAAVAIGANVNAVSWDHSSTNTHIIAIGTNTNGATSTLRLFSFTPPTTLTEISTGVTLTTQVNSVAWRPDGDCLAVGTNSGINETRVYFFENNTLTLISNVNDGNSVNGVAWSRSDNYLATGDAAATGNLDVYQSGIVSINNVFFNDVNIYMASDVTFQSASITFSGQCMINGGGNTMTLAPTFSLILNNGGSLLFQDITLDNVDDLKLRCLSNVCTFSFDNVTLVLDNNITFSQGQIDILGPLTITGSNNAFIYTGIQPINIRGGFFGSSSSAPFYQGSLIIDSNTTFSYAPANNSATLITMQSELSKIMLNSGTLIATSLQLTNGLLQIDGSSTIQTVNGFTIGNGIAANDLSIEILPAANLNILGNVIYSNA